jgi:hypothetical protein
MKFDSAIVRIARSQFLVLAIKNFFYIILLTLCRLVHLWMIFCLIVALLLVMKALGLGNRLHAMPNRLRAMPHSAESLLPLMGHSGELLQKIS